MHSHMLKTSTAGAALLALGALLTAAGLTPEQTSAARKLVASKCTTCHSLAKALRKDPVQMQAHMKKKAKLSDQELQLVVPYLTAQRSGGTNLTAQATASAGQAATDRKRLKNRKHIDDSDD